MVTASEFLKWLAVFKVATGSNPGTVTSVGTGTGLTGGTITTSGTISFAPIPAGTFWANTTGGSAVPTTVTLASILAPYLPLAGGTMTGALSMGGFALTNLPAPVAASDPATKQYADNIAAGLNPVDAVVGASTANLTGWTYNNGTAGVGATLTAPSIGVFAPDGATLNVGDRWLYKNDTTGSGAYNGIYSVTVNNAGAQAVLTRWSGYDTATDIQKGDLTAIDSGTVNADSTYLLTSQPVIIGTDPLNYSAFFTPATYLQVANNLSDVANAATARTNLGVPSLTGTGASGTWNISILGNAATATSATTATNATNVAITDDTTTNAVMYPVWVTANTGNLPAKVSSTKMSFNPSTGALTATTFIGALSGNATSATSATTATTASSVALGGITGLGTGVATALAINVGTAGAFVTNGGALGTPTSGTLTNCTDSRFVKAWGSFRWNGSAIVINKSFNVNTITRSGTGSYTVNFTNAMADANYAITSGVNSGSGTVAINVTPTNSGSFNVFTFTGGSLFDATTIFFAVYD